MAPPKGFMPPNAGKGRVKGSKNKEPLEIKLMVRKALDKSGGVKYLIQQAKENPKTFLALVAKLMPVNGNIDVNVFDGAELIERLQQGRQRVAESRDLIEGEAVDEHRTLQ
jgi:hypothetical protein